MNDDVPTSITVNRDRCESNALCVGLLPQRMTFDDDETLVVSAEPLTPDLALAAEQAIKACPRSALSLTLVPAPVPREEHP
ncbi:MAG TPA: ferredoxin [Trebonia sp.]|jgi:ferredoxin|nr:ferredoxin [Trebonia sp.]